MSPWIHFRLAQEFVQLVTSVPDFLFFSDEIHPCPPTLDCRHRIIRRFSDGWRRRDLGSARAWRVLRMAQRVTPRIGARRCRGRLLIQNWLMLTFMASGKRVGEKGSGVFSGTFRTTTGIHRRFKPKLLRDFDHPIFVSKGPTELRT